MDYLVLLFPLLLMPIVIFLIRRGRQKQLDELTATLRSEAAARGWQLETELRGYIRVIRWRGEQDGIRWIGEALEGKTGSRGTRRETSQTRWRTTGLYTGANAVSLFMGMPENTTIPKGEVVGEGLLTALAHRVVLFALDKGVDLYFGEDIGKDIDARNLKRVEELEPQLPGFAVMASVPAETTRLVSAGVARAISAEINHGPEALQGYKRPWVLFWKGGVAVGRPGAVHTAAELEPLVRAGIAITRAAVS